MQPRLLLSRLLPINRNQSATPPNEQNPLQTKLSTTSHSACVCEDTADYAVLIIGVLQITALLREECVCVYIKLLLSFVAKYIWQFSKFPQKDDKAVPSKLPFPSPSLLSSYLFFPNPTLLNVSLLLFYSFKLSVLH